MGFKGYFYTFLTLLVIGAGVAGYVYFRIEQNRKAADLALEQFDRALDEENYDKAQLALREALARVRVKDEQAVLRRELLLLLIKTSRWNEAKSEALYILEEYGGHNAAMATAYYCLGRFALDKENDTKEARLRFDMVVNDYPESEEVPGAKVGLAQIEERLGDRVEARRQLDLLVDSDGLKGDDLERAQQLLGELNIALLKSREMLDGDITYKIQKNDTVAKIAKEHNMTPELLLECNKSINPLALKVNTKIKVPNVDFSILVDKFTNTLTLLNHGKYFKKYTVRTGKYNDETPVGEYKILTKLIDPKWNDPNTGKVYPPRHPENELGTRWMAFEGSLLGIHGTIRPETIGKYSSNGCVGMLKEDVEELFDLVPYDTPVKIVGEQNPKIKEQSN